MKKIFVDMDGVLVNFQSGIDKLDETTKREYADDSKGKSHYDDVPGIFSLMDPMPGAIEGVRTLKNMGYDLYILSTAPWGNPSAWSDKVAWVTKHLDDVFHKRMIITHCKGLLAAQEGAYLIDDRTGHGASDFGERHIQFGTAEFPDWDSVVGYFLDEINCCLIYCLHIVVFVLYSLLLFPPHHNFLVSRETDRRVQRMRSTTISAMGGVFCIIALSLTQ